MNALYIAIAVILFLIWAIAWFLFDATKEIHILLGFAFIAFILGLIPNRNADEKR